MKCCCFYHSHVCVFSLVGLYAGIKFFIIDFLFKSCPKLRDKYDTPYIMWNNLPTDPQLKERSNATVSRRVRKKETMSYSNSSLLGVFTFKMSYLFETFFSECQAL